jgi:NAD(P)-dependent dehydrogenase (short-subunit alcohol dehydrogenase family)
LAKHNPEHIYFSGRDSNRAAAVIDEIKAAALNVNVTFVECDLASLSSVQNAAKQFISQSQRLDILMCNAGVMALPPGLTKDGYEVQFGTNHLGHALLIKLLLPTLLGTANIPNSDVRIIILTSLGFRLHPNTGIVFKDLRSTQDFGVGGAWMRYGQSKLANILYAAELARRYPNITTVSIHPGVVATGLVGNLSLLNKGLVYIANLGKVKKPAEGTWNQLWAATGDKREIVNGEFYEPIAILGNHDKESKNDKLAGDLWEWTQQELSVY